MSRSHNKKRNVGLLYEFLVQTISKALVDGDKKKSSAAIRILKRHFKPGTELHKELRIVNALCKTTVSKQSVAANIISEAKSAVRSHDTEQLYKQKTSLIHDVNRSFPDCNFYDQHVGNYRTLATIQTLFEGWRSKEVDLQRMAMLEEQLLNHLTAEKQVAGEDTMVTESVGEGRLLMKVMMKKLNEKYSGALTSEQKGLLRAYAFSATSNDPETVRLKLREMKASLVSAIDSYCSKNNKDTYVVPKLNEVKSQLMSESLECVDDNTVTSFMMYAKLTSELMSEEKEDV